MTQALSLDERACWLEADGETVLAVVTRPSTTPRGVGVILLNGGNGVSSAGKNAVQARMAADLAERGFHSIRLEWHGIGDSTGAIDEFVYDVPFVAEALAAADELRSEGVDRIAIYGECFGARTATAAAPQIPDLVATYLVTLLLRDGAVSEQTSQRHSADLPVSTYIRRLGKVRHLLDPDRRRLYRNLIVSKARQLSGDARRSVSGSRLPTWVSGDVVDELAYLATRDVRVNLVYGTSKFDKHGLDFVAIRDDLEPLRHPGFEAEVMDEMMSGYRTLQVQDRLVDAVGQWLDQVTADQPGA